MSIFQYPVSTFNDHNAWKEKKDVRKAQQKNRINLQVRGNILKFSLKKTSEVKKTGGEQSKRGSILAIEDSKKDDS